MTRHAPVPAPLLAVLIVVSCARAPGAAPEAALVTAGAVDAAHAVTATDLKAGDPAPDFSLNERDGTGWTLSDALHQGPVVLVFYRGHWCPKCRGQLDRLQARLGEVEGKGASLVAISVDPVEDTNKLADRHGYTFPMLTDPDLAAIRAYGVEDVGNDISLPATVVVGKDGTIAFVYVGDAPGDRPAEDMSIAAIP